MKNILLILIAIVLFSSCKKDVNKTIYLVRHAEKDSFNPNNPALSIEGVMRSVDLEKWFIGKSIDTLISSDTKRAMETATPLSEDRNMNIGIYDPMNFEEIAKQLIEID